MTTDAGNADRSSDRAEEVFAAMTAGPNKAEPPPEESNPWRLASFLLLLLALALPIAFGIRISRDRMAFDKLVHAATVEIEAARDLAGEGDAVAAFEGFYKALDAMADVEQAPEAAAELRSLLTARLADLERERRALELRDRRAASHRRALQAVLAGTPARAEATIRDEGAADSVGKLIGDLAVRVAQLDRIEGEDAESRAVALGRLTDAWPLAALSSMEKRARAAVMQSEREVEARGRASRSFSSEDPEVIRAGLVGLLEVAGYSEGMKLLQAWRRRDLLVRAAEASDGSKHRAAEALFSAAGAPRLAAEASRFAAAEELKTVRAAQHEHLIGILTAVAEEAEKAGGYDHAEALYFMLSTLTDEEEHRAAVDRNRAAHLLATAKDLAKAGFHAAAASRARLVGAHGSNAGTAFAKEQAEAAVREEMHKWAHLLEGAQAAAMFESAPETLRAIQEALGQTDLDTDKSLETARINRVVLDAIMDMDKGAVAKVRETMLMEPAAAALAPGLAARAELMTGWVDEGLARLKDDPEQQIALLFRSAAAVFEDDPVAAGRLLAKAQEIAGGDIGLVGALAAMIDAAAESDEESILWAMLLAEAESRLPRETPEAPETPETPENPRDPEIE